MDTSNNIVAIVYFDGSISTATNEGVTFICDEPTFFTISQTMSFVELNAGLCQDINGGNKREVVKIKYRCPISIVNGNIKYQAVKISSDNDMRLLCMTYRQFQPHITVIELYVEFEDVAKANDDGAGPSSCPVKEQCDEEVPTSCPANQQCNETILRSCSANKQCDETVPCVSPANHQCDETVPSSYPQLEEVKPSPFPIRGTECEINNSESDNFLEQEHRSGGNGADDTDGCEDEENVPNRVAIEHPFKPVPFMRTLDLEAMHAPEFPEYVNVSKNYAANGELCVGMLFKNKEGVVQAIKNYSLSKSVDYKVHESEPATFYCKCKYFGSGCKWLVRVSFIKNKDVWEIRRYNGPHTCNSEMVSQDHTKLDSDMIAQHIGPMVRDDPSFNVNNVISEIQSRYGYTTTYRKAYLAKQKAIENVYGSWEGSFEILPKWLEALSLIVHGSIVELETLPAYHGTELLPNVRLFHRLFWTFGPCIKAFEHCKPIVQVDGTHLHGKYEGTLLVAVAQDGNQSLLPIAFAIVDDETVDAWYFFLFNLRKHVVMKDGVTIISDDHESIRTAINRCHDMWAPPKAFHMYCIRHIASNFLRKFEKPYLHRLVVSIGYSRTEREYNYHYKQMCQHGDAYTKWLDEIPREKWVQAFDGGHRYGHMTTNLVECISSVLKGVRNLPIAALVRATYLRLCELFASKSREVYARKDTGNVFSEMLMTRLQKNQLAAESVLVTAFISENEIFYVQEPSSKEELKVDLRHGYCDCGDFQTDRYPCPHVIACCSNQNINWEVYVNDIYRIDKVCKLYEKEFEVVGHQSTWPVYNGPRIQPNSLSKRNMKGRPKSTSFLNEMDEREIHQLKRRRREGLRGKRVRRRVKSSLQL
ncbi:uncharacterized protein LOC130940554 [Arachis stenosperma]|uniref:uncharacterized protein LOC130940554 n=1 Tax=Arachis stenosperma TaxID=217475 RepID=UPI0025ACE447|nr:uncharacterized protein LOC130940554 [Arachis stenosperma]